MHDSILFYSLRKEDTNIFKNLKGCASCSFDLLHTFLQLLSECELKSICNPRDTRGGRIKRQIRQSAQSTSAWYHVGFSLFCEHMLPAPWQPQQLIGRCLLLCTVQSCYEGYWFFTCLLCPFMVHISCGFSGAAASRTLTFCLVLDDFEGQEMGRGRGNCDKNLRSSQTENIIL